LDAERRRLFQLTFHSPEAGFPPRRRPRKVYTESGGTQKGCYQLYARHQPHVSCIETFASTDKLDQAGNFFALAQAGRVWLPSPDVDAVSR
jgi:hypothetical protein